MAMLDAAIIGRGVAGLACALLLVRRGRSVVVFGGPAGGKTIETAPPATVHAMARLGLHLTSLPRARPSAGTLSLWGDDVPRAVDYVAQAPGTGWEVERSALDAQLAETARAAGVILDETRISRVRPSGDGWALEFAEPSPPRGARAKFLILANGRAGSTFGLASRRSADALVAVSFRSAQAASDSRTWIEAQPAGWWYSVPGGCDERALAFFSDAALLPASRAVLPDWCRAALAQSKLISRRVCPSAIHSARVVCASSRRLDPPAGARWAAIGDAVAAFDPISSAGLRFACESAQRAADIVCAASDVQDFPAWIDSLWNCYAVGLRATYGRERRWLNAPFWRHRLAACRGS